MIGETVGSYRITAALGTGGVGEVFRAEHTGTGEPVLVEIVAEQLVTHAEPLAAYLAGVEKLVTVKHPSLVRVIEAATDAAGRTFVVTEPIEGETLAIWIEKLGRLSITQIAEVSRQLSHALAAIHDEGLVHGDLRPGCIWLPPEGELSRTPIKLSDVGSALFKRACGIRMGPVYMAPEVWSANATDWRIDAYALGCVVFEMATGKPPYIGKSAEEVRAKHLSARSPSARAQMPDVPPSLDVMLGRLLSKQPEDRYGSMREIARTFESQNVGMSKSLAPTATDTPVFQPGADSSSDIGVMSGELKARALPPQDKPPEPSMNSIIAEGGVETTLPPPPVRHSAGETAMMMRASKKSPLAIIIIVVVLLAGGVTALVLAFQ